jgi:hypothetical protein
MKKTIIFIVAILVPFVAWAGYNQTNPKNHRHTVYNQDDKAVLFEPLLRIGWVGNEENLDQVKYKIHNLSTNYSIVIQKVNVLNPGGSVVWTRSPYQSIKKKETKEKEWRDNEIKSDKVKRVGATLEFQIGSGSRVWCLTWNPSVSGSASTAVNESYCN